MKTIKAFILFVSVCFMLSGCLPLMPAREEPHEEVVNNIVTFDIPSGEVTYRTSLPYLASQTKGTTATTNSNYDVSHRLDLTRIELGLLELAQSQFDPDKYLFQEGQVISSDDVEDWLGRYHAEKNRLGLNPENGPNQLIHILEHDYLKMDSKELSGIAISLAVPSAIKSSDGKEKSLTAEEQREKVKILAGKIVERIRAKKVEVPILIAGYSLEVSTSVIPGHFISYAVAGKGDVSIGDWKNIDEHYVLYPGRSSRTEREKEIGAAFTDFQAEVQTFFRQYAGVTGLARFRSDQPFEMTITIRADYSSKTEVIALVQYIAGILPNYFPNEMKINVYIETNGRSEAVYIRPVKGDPFFHLYR